MNKDKMGKFIARVRKARKVTTYDLQKVGVHPQQIKTIEEGGNYTVDTLQRVVDLLKLTVTISE